MPLLIQKLIDVEVSELTEKARTDSTGRPRDPDFKFLKKPSKMQSDSQKKLLSIEEYIFAIRGIRSSFENQKRCCHQSKTSLNQNVSYCRMPDVIHQRHTFLFFYKLVYCNEHFVM